MEKKEHPIVKELSILLSDTYLVYIKTQNFHWNVTGEWFPMLHAFFEGQYKELADAVDEIAERIRMLDSFSPAGTEQFRQLSDIKEETRIPDGQEMIRILVKDHEHIIKHLNEFIKKAQKENDEGTADLFIERLRAHQKMRWMLKSSLK